MQDCRFAVKDGCRTDGSGKGEMQDRWHAGSVADPDDFCAPFDIVYSTALRQWVYAPYGTVLQSSLKTVCIVQLRDM